MDGSLPVIGELFSDAGKQVGLDEIYRISARPESRFLFLEQTFVRLWPNLNTYLIQMEHYRNVNIKYIYS